MSKMAQQVTVTLTVAEALALSEAVGEAFSRDLFFVKSDKKIAKRAWDKLVKAYGPIYYCTEPASTR